MPGFPTDLRLLSIAGATWPHDPSVSDSSHAAHSTHVRPHNGQILTVSTFQPGIDGQECMQKQLTFQVKHCI